MNFGPRWSNIVAESSVGEEALLVHALPEEFRDDWATTVLHPAVLDMATAGAQHLIPGVDTTKDLLVPAGYGELRLRRPLRGNVTSHVTLRSADGDGALASFDVTIYDGNAEVAVVVRDFSMVKVEGGALRQGDADTTPAWLRDAIAPSEGREALRRLLAHPCGSHVFVVPRPVDVLVREAHAQPVRSRKTDVPRSAPARVPLPAVAEALLANAAVADAVALGSPDADAPRVVAFVAFRPGSHATVSELRRFLRTRVEKSLVPQNFVEMVALPRAEDGTVALDQLRDPFASVDDFVAPRTPTEATIAQIWSELLALERVGIHDNFLDVGGHSLVGIRVLRRIQQETGVRLEANALTMQTLEQLAADVDRAAAAGPAR
jgi:hypothetical protein